MGNLGDNDDGRDGDTNTADKATFYHSATAHPTRGRLRIDKAKNVNNWAVSEAGIHLASWDRTDGLDKVYAARNFGSGQELIGVGDVHRSDTGFHVFRQSDTSADQEQDA